MKKTILLSFVVIGILSIYFLSPFEGNSKEQAVTEVVKVSKRVKMAQDFIASLKADQKSLALFDLKDEERFNWHYIPRERKGLDLRNMDEGQKVKAFALLNSYLSDQGMEKAKGIMQLEVILKAIENLPADNDRRHPEKYYFSIFGNPSDETPWGWRVEGHHLSLNFTSVSDELMVTPAFMGSNPAKVPSGEKKGFRILKDEEDFGRSLIKMLTADQQKIAIISKDAPDDILTGQVIKERLEKFSGLKFTDMTETQKAQMKKLLNLYLSNMEKDIAKTQMQIIQDAGGFDELYFAWAGSLEVGDRHYYRVHGPTFVIEYDNTQNDANHVHTVFRDFTSDFGEDLLAKHYSESDAGHGHSHDPGEESHTH